MTTKKYVLMGVALVVLVVLGWWAFSSPAPVVSPVAVTPSTTTAGAVVPGGPTTTAPVVQKPGSLPVVQVPPKNGPTTAPVPVTAPMLSAKRPSIVSAPAANARWVFAEQNTIQWDKPANITGGIYLVNAATGATVGWILQQTGPNQVSFPWNTRDIQTSRTSPTKITVPVGTYIVKVMFDSPQDPTITSAPFTIIAPNQAQVSTANVAIAKAAFSPASLTVKRGTKITFTNSDQAGYQVLVSGYSPFSIAAGGSYIFDTTSLSPAPYALYSATDPGLRMTVTVQ